MKKINFIGEFSDKSFEGFMKIVNNLRNKLKKEFLITINGKEKNYDIINIHAGGFLPAIKKRNNNKPIIFSLHGNFGSTLFKEIYVQYQLNKYILDKNSSNSKNSFSNIRKLFYRLVSISTPNFIKRLFFKKFDLVIVPNNYMKKKLKLKNVKVIRHGIDLNKFKPIKTKLEKKVKVAYFGHLSIEKGILEVVNAFSKISLNIEKTIFVTELTTTFKKYTEKTDKRVVLKGYVKDIAKAYNSQDIIVLPFRDEVAAIGTPLVLIEAMACGKAIITTNLLYLKEYCSNSVFYIDPYDQDQLVKAIKKLKTNKELRKKLGNRARKRAKKYFDEKVMLTDYERIYRSFL